MRIKRTLLHVTTATAAVAILASCGAGSDDAGGPSVGSDQTTVADAQSPTYDSLDELGTAVLTAADCDEERWDYERRSEAADSDTGMPAVDTSHTTCSLAEDDGADAWVQVYFAPLDGTSAEIVQALKVDLSVSNSIFIQGDRWVVRVDQATIRGGSDSGGDEERDAYSEKLADSLKSALDENAQVTYKGDA